MMRVAAVVVSGLGVAIAGWTQFESGSPSTHAPPMATFGASLASFGIVLAVLAPRP